jgi:crotonobetainyl-CoA:carnitine CoA-transferase CaiB-like acyl-CoA transferase
VHAILAGKRVIELGTMLAAPFAAHVLAQLGAEVIKIEPPIGDPTRKMVRGGPGGTLIAYSRGKKSICIDLKTSEGQAVLEKLVATTDILVHNLAPQSARRLNVTYEQCRRSNPELVYCHIQGYGPGPRADDLASNPLIEAATGVMHDHRIDGRPSRLGPSYHDQFAGLYAVIGILAALDAPLGERRVEVGLYEAGLHVAARDLAGFQLKQQIGVEPTGDGGGEFALPGYGAYETADGRWIYLVMLTDAHWSKFCQALAPGQGKVEALATLRGRKTARPRVEEIVRNAIRDLTYDQAAARLQTVGFGFTEVKTGMDVLKDPQAQQPGKLASFAFGGFQFALPNLPMPRQLLPAENELPPPLLGEHTIDIMRALGFSDPECAALKASGAVVVAEGGPEWAAPRERRIS